MSTQTEKKIVVLEYVWIDAFDNTRSKNKVVTIQNDTKLMLDDWMFDGSSKNWLT